VDLDRLTPGDRIVAVSAILLLIFSFLPWFEVSADFGDGSLVSGENLVTGNGWDTGFLWSGIPVILGLVMLAHIGLSRFSPDTTIPEAPWGTIHLVLGAITAGLVVLKFLLGVDEGELIPGADAVPDEFLEDFDISVSRQFGLFLAALAALGLLIGGLFKFRELQGEAGSGAAPPQAF
jgi:hypothetical protein